MLVRRQKQMSFYDALYEKIPEDHLLRLIDKAVDFGFVNELLSDSYCRSFGRPAKEPEMMLKLLLLQRLYDLSDVRVIEEASLNLAFLWFLRLLEGGGETSCIMGDKAYFRRDILDAAKEIGAKTYIPVSASAYRIDEAMFSYNKDSDEWSCAMGNTTVSLRRIKRKRGNRDYEVLAYRFSKEQCMACTKRAECMGRAKGAKELHVSTSAALFYEESARQKDPVFLERYKKRAAIEWKNAELKCHHGMARAKGYGLGSVSMQVKLTALAVNCKRMAAIVARKASEAIKRDALAPSSLGAAVFISLWHLKGRLLGFSATYRPFCLHFGH